jgi:hypothetical protein
MTGIYQTQLYATNLNQEVKNTLNRQLADLISEEFDRQIPLVMHLLEYKIEQTEWGHSKAIAVMAVVCASYLDAYVGDLCFNPSIAPETCNKGDIITITERKFESLAQNLWKRIS